jgi:hypothetical protein
MPSPLAYRRYVPKAAVSNRSKGNREPSAADLLLPRSWRFGFQINDQTGNAHSESKQRIF